MAGAYGKQCPLVTIVFGHSSTLLTSCTALGKSPDLSEFVSPTCPELHGSWKIFIKIKTLYGSEMCLLQNKESRRGSISLGHLPGEPALPGSIPCSLRIFLPEWLMMHCHGLVNEEPARPQKVMLKEHEVETTGAIIGKNSQAMVASGPIKPHCFGGWLLSSSNHVTHLFSELILTTRQEENKTLSF